MATGHENSNTRRQREIVVAGGIQINSVEAFDVENEAWRALPHMNERRAYASSVVHQNRMIVTGGYVCVYMHVCKNYLNTLTQSVNCFYYQTTK